VRDLHEWGPLENVERPVWIVLIQGFRTWRQTISGEDFGLVSPKHETYTIGALLRTWNGRSGLYLYIGVDPGGKLFRVRVPYLSIRV